MNRLRRCELATPASSKKMLEKSAGLGADLVFLDLEDACAPDVKDEARANAVEALIEFDWGNTVRAVRVNGLDTPWCFDDVVEVVTGAHDAVDILIIPKVRRPRDVWWFDVLLGQLEHKLGLTTPIGLEVLIEEAEGLVNAADIAVASPRLEAMILGAGDLSASLRSHVDTNFQPVHPYPGDFWHYARFQVVTAARAAGIDAIDAPFPAYQEPDAYREDATRASSIGFDGKWAIHPSQVEIAHDVFSPDEAGIAWAERTRDAWQTAAAQGAGATSVDGMLVDAAHMRHVETLLARADKGRNTD